MSSFRFRYTIGLALGAMHCLMHGMLRFWKRPYLERQGSTQCQGHVKTIVQYLEVICKKNNTPLGEDYSYSRQLAVGRWLPDNGCTLLREMRCVKLVSINQRMGLCNCTLSRHKCVLSRHGLSSAVFLSRCNVMLMATILLAVLLAVLTEHDHHRHTWHTWSAATSGGSGSG